MTFSHPQARRSTSSRGATNACVKDRDFEPLRKACFARDDKCMAPLEWGRCWGPWTAHHVVTRARDKTLTLDLENLRTLCLGHHDYVHDHPAEATALGLLKSASLLSPQPNQGNR